MAESQFASLFHPEPADILIAVMGITGSGKSTFISHCTDESVPIGISLRSHTKSVKAYRYALDNNKAIYLIDTPGFDDTERDDTEVLRDIAAWITDAYKRSVQLQGILYLHRITDTRMQGAAMRNLFMFKKLCGPDALKNVILVTTMWENDKAPEGDRREKELQETPEYWGSMIEKGSQIVRHYNSRRSAEGIVKSLLSSRTATTLAIQDEMVNQDKHLDQTSAGIELQTLLARERERFAIELANLQRDMLEAQTARDKESQDQIRQLQQEKNADITNLQQQQERMMISLEKLHEEKYGELERRLQEQQALLHKQKEAIDGMTAAATRDKENYQSEIQALARQLEATTTANPPLSSKLKTDKHSLRMLFCGAQYIFSGPSGTVINLTNSKFQDSMEQFPSRSEVVAFGPPSALLRIWQNAESQHKILCSQDFKDDYPELFKLLRDFTTDGDLSSIKFISLGCNGSYFLRNTTYSRWKLDPEAYGLPSNSERVWYGYRSSWVAKLATRDGIELQWDLNGS